MNANLLKVQVLRKNTLFNPLIPFLSHFPLVYFITEKIFINAAERAA